MKKVHTPRRILNPIPAKNFRVHRIMEDGTYRVSKKFPHKQAADTYRTKLNAPDATWVRPEGVR